MPASTPGFCATPVAVRRLETTSFPLTTACSASLVSKTTKTKHSMPSKPKPNDMLDSPIGCLATAIADEAKKWTKLAKSVEDCFVTTTAFPMPQLDPFKATLVLEQIAPAFRAMSNPREREIDNLKTWAD